MNDRRDLDLDRRVSQLPRTLNPERDLWVGIESRIAELAARPSLRAPRLEFVFASGALLAAAAAACLLVAGGDGRPASPDSSPVPSALTVPSPAPALRMSGDALEPAADALEPAKERVAYRSAVQALEASLAESRRHWSSRDAERVDQSLGVLDHAIVATEQALSRHPDSVELQAQLWDVYQQKVDTLVMMVDLLARTS